MKKWLLLLLSGLFALLFSACGGGAQPSGPESLQQTEETKETIMDFSCDAVFFGDSITADGNFDALFPDLQVVNLGVYGDTLTDLLARVPAVQAKQPAAILLLGGINSLREDTFSDCVEQYDQLLEALQTACPQAELVVQSVLPVAEDLTAPGIITNDTIRRFNEELKALASKRGCAYVDLWPGYEKDGALDPAMTRDGLHLNYTAYGPWADLLKPILYAEP